MERIADCTRWPMRADCDQACLPDALRAAPYTAGEVGPPKMKQIYHLPVLIAAFIAWVFGVVWHSQYFFREPWMLAWGLDRPELRQLAVPRTPHLLSGAVCLLFAYGVAWLIASTHKKGVGAGIITSLFLWGSIALASLAVVGLAAVPRDFLRIESGYTFLASIAIGAIIGGLNGRLMERTFSPSTPLRVA